MSIFQNGGVDYDPAQYGKNRPGRMMLVDQYFKEWESRQLYKGPPQEYQIPPNICLSRQVGVGALEVADLLSQDLGLPVVDKMILDIICESKQLTEKTVQIFDERRPGLSMELSSWLFGEKSFISGDYSRELLRAVAAIAGLGPNIFLGRGAYLLLPRNRTLAVRLVGSREYRSRRIAQIMERELVTEDAVGALERFDREQQGFFKKMFRKKEMTMEEFDLVINREQFPRASSVTAVIKTAYTEKFKDES
ncbi:cytidylate kinase-like family protein [Desulfatibacillum aliphaticivorans]|uniref:cytidylate kinase-like family protein n=1 Tax=Desulfatibacillum aliphaticivorans TaxID=218208 RepID=UPI00068817CD|nr:cytidylate kinase-like family protein [Desulfatibacillum aliphaticivorans]